MIHGFNSTFKLTGLLHTILDNVFNMNSETMRQDTLVGIDQLFFIVDKGMFESSEFHSLPSLYHHSFT